MCLARRSITFSERLSVPVPKSGWRWCGTNDRDTGLGWKSPSHTVEKPPLSKASAQNWTKQNDSHLLLPSHPQRKNLRPNECICTADFTLPHSCEVERGNRMCHSSQRECFKLFFFFFCPQRTWWPAVGGRIHLEHEAVVFGLWAVERWVPKETQILIMRKRGWK